MSTDLAFVRLIALRRHSLEELRTDMNTLDALVQDCHKKSDQARSEHLSFIEETRQTEAEQPLVPTEMLERRRYAGHLLQRADRAAEVLREVSEQHQHAQQAFNDCYTEIRKLERVAERRRDALQQELKRKQYLVADDQEILRMERSKERAYGAN